MKVIVSMKRLLWLLPLAALIVVLSHNPKSEAQQNITTLGCSKSAVYDASTNGSTKLVTGNSTQQIYICGFNFFAAGTANVKLISGTGTTCGTSTAALTPAYQLTTQTGIVDHQIAWTGIGPIAVSTDLCINTSAGVAVQGIVYYSQTQF